MLLETELWKLLMIQKLMSIGNITKPEAVSPLDLTPGTGGKAYFICQFVCPPLLGCLSIQGILKGSVCTIIK